MEEQQTSTQRLCTKNCGFYGSSQFEGMCSKCYRDHVNRSNNAGRTESFPTFFSSSSRSNSVNESEQLDVQSSSEFVPSPTVETTVVEPTIEPTSSSPTSNDSIGATASSDVTTTSSSVEKKKRNRCCWQDCNKKLGLTGFQCRCGGEFCSLHRYANEHQCTFDYKEMGQNEIRKNMPVVQAERVRRI